MARLKKQINDTADEKLEALLNELESYPPIAKKIDKNSNDAPAIVVPLKIESQFGTLAFISTTTVFGTPVDVTVSEIALETFFPADDATRKIFNKHLNL